MDAYRRVEVPDERMSPSGWRTYRIISARVALMSRGNKERVIGALVLACAVAIFDGVVHFWWGWHGVKVVSSVEAGIVSIVLIVAGICLLCTEYK